MVDWTMRADTEKDFRNILDTFTGADGGVRFAKAKMLVASMDQKAAKGDQAAHEVIQIMKRFSRLLDIANGPIHEEK